MRIIAAVLLLLCSTLIFAGSKSNNEAATEICQVTASAVDWARWEGKWSKEATLAHFEGWIAQQTDRESSSLRFSWYELAVRTLIDSGYAAQDREAWKSRAIQECLAISAGQT